MHKKFKTAVLGGTFDLLHIGHKEFIKFALSISDKLVIGLTSDDYVVNSKSETRNPELIQRYEERKKVLEDFLKEGKITDRVSIVKINDVYGITLDKNFNIDALVVVDKTLSGAEKINEKRKELGLFPLEIIIAPSVMSEDGKVISSSAIRNGEIDRNGKLWVEPQWLKETLFLSDKLREQLKKPFGKIVSGQEIRSSELMVTVGDVTTEKFNRLSLNQKISIVDLNVGRKKKFNTVLDLGFSKAINIIKVHNPAGQITPGLFSAVKNSFTEGSRVVIQVLGEEDLAVLPVVLAAPIGVIIFYGQPNQGIVKVCVNEKNKQEAYSFLSQFITRGH